MKHLQKVRQGIIVNKDNAAYEARLAQKAKDKQITELIQRVQDLENRVRVLERRGNKLR